MASNEEENFCPEFEEVYQKEIAPKLQELENYRLSKFNIYRKYNKGGFFILPSVLFMLACIFLENAILGIIGGILISTGIFLITKTDKIKNDLRNKLKENLLTPLLALFGKFELINTETMTLNDVRSLGLYRISQSKNDDDIIIGTYKDIPVELIESKLTHVERVGTGNSTMTFTDFKGLIFKCKLNKNFNCRVSAGWRAYSSDKEMEIVKLEDTEFNKRFPVYSNNQVEARYLITPSFIERIKNIENVFPITYAVNFAFYEGYFYLFINYYSGADDIDYNLFEVGEIKKTIINKKNFLIVYNQLKSIFLLVDYFKLNENTRL